MIVPAPTAQGNLPQKNESPPDQYLADRLIAKFHAGLRHLAHSAEGRPPAWFPVSGMTGLGRALKPQLLLALAERAQPQRVELDEAGGVAVVVGDSTFLEGDEVLVVQ